jgi:tetratricopeptide (TPR) repeat protein
VLARSQGNPFFAEELLAAGPNGDRSVLPATVHEVLAARVDALSVPGQHALRVAAVAGERVGHGLLAAASGLDQAELLPALREAVEYHVLVPDVGGEAYAFRHALLREVVQADLLPGERGQLHAALARALAAHPELAGGTPAQAAAELATHWYESHDLAEALPAAVAAGVAAEQALAFAEAQRHFERAVGLWDQVPDVAAGLPLDRAGLLGRAAEAAYLARDQQRAVALARAALAIVDASAEPVRAALLAERLGWYLWLTDSDQALDAYQHALGLLPTEPPSAARAWVLARQAEALNACSRVRAARASAEQALAIARLVGARREEGWALLALGNALFLLGERDEGLDHLRQARTIAEELGEVNLLALTFEYLPQVLEAAGRQADALAEVLQGIQTGRRLGLERFQDLGGLAALFCFQLGRWQDADRYLRQGMAANPMPTMPAIATRVWQAQLEVERGEFAAAAARLEEVTRAVPKPPRPQFGDHFAARAALAIWQDRLDDARAVVQAGLEWLAGTEEELYFRPLLTLGLRAEADRAERSRARRATDEAETARRVGTGLLARLRQLVDQAAAPQPETLAHALLGEAEAHPPGRPRRPRALGGGDGRMGGARPALPGRLRPLAASRGAAHPARCAGRGHHRAPPGPSDRPAARGGALAPRGRRPGPARPDRPGRAPSRRGRTRTAGRPVRAHPPRARGARPGRRRAQQPPDRPGAVHQPQDRRHPRLQHPGQARRGQPRRGRRGRPPRRARRPRLIRTWPHHRPPVTSPGTRTG